MKITITPEDRPEETCNDKRTAAKIMLARGEGAIAWNMDNPRDAYVIGHVFDGAVRWLEEEGT